MGIPIKLLTITLLIFILTAVNWRYHYSNLYSYKFKKSATEFIINHANSRPFKLNFIDKHAFGYLDGFRYLFSLYGYQENDDKVPLYNIYIPPPPSRELDVFGNIGVELPNEYK